MTSSVRSLLPCSLMLVPALFIGVAGCGDDGMSDPDGGASPCPAACDDGIFCNGVETCDPTAGCVAGTPPCVEGCDEDTDRCAAACAVEEDMDGDGAIARMCGGDDCDDGDANAFPGATEVCDAEGVDEDCDPATFGSLDGDGDGIVSATCCNGDTCGTDCNDGNANIGPGQTEACDSLDNDCDGSVDEGALTTYYPDMDGDDFGDPSGVTVMACSQPSGYSENDRDCDDAVAAVNPGAAEVCDGSGDNDCNPDTPSPYDEDGDGYDSAAACADGTDPNDQLATVYPGAPEVCDGYDSNGDGAEDLVRCQCMGTCTGWCDEGTCDTERPNGTCDGSCTGLCVGSCGGTCGPGADSVSMPGEDQDEDGFLSGSTTCSGGPRDGLPRTDCNDRDPTFGPGVPEACDGLDNDCDTNLDEGLADVSTTPVPDGPVFLDGMAFAPDFSCVGTGSRPALGADTTSTLTIVDVDGNPLPDGTSFEVWAQGVAPVGACTGPSCTLNTVGASGQASVLHRENEIVTLVFPTMRAITILPPGEVSTAVTMSGSAAPETLGLTFKVLDCTGAPLGDTIHARAYRPGIGACGTIGVNYVTANDEPVLVLESFTPALASTAETVIVEIWGKTALDTPFQVLARETVYLQAGYRTYRILGPLRSDSPPRP